MAFLPAVGVAFSAASSILGGITQANAASYQAQVARNNAKAERQNAVYAAQASSARITQEQQRAGQRLAGVEAGIAANNLETTTGSAADVIAGQHALGQTDVATVGNQGALQVYGYESQARNFEAQAALDKAQVLPDIVGGVLKAGGALGAGAPQLGIGPSGGNGFTGFPEGSIATDTGFASTLASGAPSLPDRYAFYGGNDNLDNFGP